MRSEKLKFIIFNKGVYILLLFANILVLIFSSENRSFVDSYSRHIIALGMILLFINLHNIIKIITRRLTSWAYSLEIMISLYRLGGVLVVASVILGQFIILSPLAGSLWLPMTRLLSSPYGIFYWYVFLLILFVLELYNLRLLRRKRDELRARIPAHS